MACAKGMVSAMVGRSINGHLTCGGQCASVYQQLKMHKAAGDDPRDILHTAERAFLYKITVDL